MFTLSIVLEEDHLDNLEKRIRELQEAEIEVGYFQEQGNHYSGISYPDLIALHANGSEEMNMPSRDVMGTSFDIFNADYANEKKLKSNIEKYLSNIKSKSAPISVNKLGESWSDSFMDSANAVFGNPLFLAPNSEFTKRLKDLAGVDPDKPLVWTGDLQDNLTYRFNGQLIKNNSGR